MIVYTRQYVGKHLFSVLPQLYTTIAFPEFEPGLINRELNNVADWYSLGVNLGLSTDYLDIIRCEFGREGVMQCRLTMLTQWYNGCFNASWSDLISALVLTDKRRLAHVLAQKYSELQSITSYISVEMTYSVCRSCVSTNACQVSTSTHLQYTNE